MRRRAAKARNPSRDFATVKRQFHQILQNDHSAAGLEVALDLLRDHDVSLERVSELQNTEDGANGVFLLRGEGEKWFEYVEWWVEWAEPEFRGQLMIPRWSIDLMVKVDGINLTWIASDQLHHIYSGFTRIREWFTPGRFADRTAATTVAVGLAWLAVEILVATDPPIDSFELIRGFLDSVWGPWGTGIDRAHFEKMGIRVAENRELVSNPPWVTAVIADNWSEIESSVPAQWHPKLDKVHAMGARLTGRVKEFGCGAYGCVMPTLDPNIVLKATSDVTEAEFAKDLAPRLVAPICVIYQMVMKVDATRKGNPVYLLWRESARDVGELENSDAVDLIDAQHDLANELFRAIHSSPMDDGEIRLASAAWLDSLDSMANAEDLELGRLAEGMRQVFDEQGIAILDVHAGNIGRVTRNGRDMWVITDPGHVVVIGNQR